MNRFYVFNAGCIRRALDMAQVQKYLVANGWRMTRRPGAADLIVVATCGVVRLNEINSLRAVAEAARNRRNGARIVVSGCLPKINPEAISALGEFLLVPSGQMERLDPIVRAQTPYAAVPSADSVTENRDLTNYLIARSYCRRSRIYKWLFQRYGMSGPFLAVSVRAGKAIEQVRGVLSGAPVRTIIPYFNIKIADGCLSNCAFCATKFATGGLRSKPIERVLDEFRSGLARGYTVFQLIAEDTGAYGKDTGTDITTLLRRIFAIDAQYRLIIIDCCPQWLVEQRSALVPLLVANQDRVQELFVPIQSGSDRILRLMKRNYSAAEVRDLVRELQDRAPQIALRTSFLIGFPGETEQDFTATKQFIAELRGISEVTVNRYEDRPGTRASTMPDKVPQEQIELRARILARELNCRILS